MMPVVGPDVGVDQADPKHRPPEVESDVAAEGARIAALAETLLQGAPRQKTRLLAA